MVWYLDASSAVPSTMVERLMMNSKDLWQELREVGGSRRSCWRCGGSRRRGARRGRNTVIGASAWCICQRGGEEVVVSGLLSELDRMIVGNQGGKGGGRRM